MPIAYSQQWLRERNIIHTVHCLFCLGVEMQVNFSAAVGMRKPLLAHQLFHSRLNTKHYKLTLNTARFFDMLSKLLKPTGHVLHQQFNIRQLYALPTLYLCVLCLSEYKQRLVPLTA